VVQTDDAFLNWLAGFADGEGCFAIDRPRKGTNIPRASFRIGLRDDDAAVLAEIQAVIGGYLYRGRKNGPYSPIAMLQITNRTDCLRLVEVLDSHPLRAKKRREFAVWREAVRCWAEKGPHGGRSNGASPEYLALMDDFRSELHRLKGYGALESVPNPIKQVATVAI